MSAVRFGEYLMDSADIYITHEDPLSDLRTLDEIQVTKLIYFVQFVPCKNKVSLLADPALQRYFLLRKCKNLAQTIEKYFKIT